MNAPEYPIGTFRQMAAIPAEALPRFLAELPTILAEAREMYARIDLVEKALGEDAALEIVSNPIWVDDDKSTFTQSIQVEGEDEPFLSIKQKRGPSDEGEAA